MPPSKDRPMTREKWDTMLGFTKRTEYLRKGGARPLGDAMEEFLFETSYENHCASIEKRDARPMTGRERKMKHDFLQGIRRDLKSIEYLYEPLNGRNRVDSRFWFDDKDVAAALEMNRVLTVVRLCLNSLPADRSREYAVAILNELHSFFAAKGEQIQIVRTFGLWATLDLLGIQH
jgi:hypothetical protein